jgi:serine/threonine protein kinase/predicted Zn-dependent protease
MGEVYLARDTQLDRVVALKLLPPAFTGDADRIARFVQEAKAASALNHPNILTVHEVGHVDGQWFIASEFVEGRTLRDRMKPGPIGVANALDLTIQIAGALAAAHAAGVVHRDIKPENLMLRPDGYLKVVDFGLAKLADVIPPVDASTAPTAWQLRTDTGVVLGTARYMSPEQTRGSAVDARTDLFALGVVLFEMLAGRPPFDGPTTSDLIVAILEKEAPALARFRLDVSPEIERIIQKALRKDPDERYQTARDFQTDLKNARKQLDAASHAKSRPARRGRLVAAGAVALAVLVAAIVAVFYMRGRPALTERDTILLADFVNTTGEPEFDGSTLKQALTSNLRQTPFLNLFPEEATRETLRMMGRPAEARVTRDVGREIAQRQRLKALLVGTIAMLGRHYVLTLEAVNGQTGETVASQQIEAEGKEQVLQALGRAATELRRSLGESLGTIQKYNAPMERVTTTSLEALKAYSTGMDVFVTRGDAQGAIPLFKRAIDLDQNFAGAYDILAWASANVGDGRTVVQAAEKAYSLRDRVTELEKFYVTETYHHWVTGDWDAQNENARLGRRLYPNDWTFPHDLSINHASLGRDDDALKENGEAIRLNPNVVHVYRFQAIALAHLNRFDEARKVIEQTQAKQLDGPFFQQTLYAIAVAQGDQAAMKRQLELIRERSESQALLLEARTAVSGGRWREALSLYRRVAGPVGQRGTPAAAPLPLEAIQVGALFGFCQPADPGIMRMLAVTRIGSATQRLPVPIRSDGSLCGDPDDAQKLVDEVGRRYPQATAVKGFSRPVIGAAIALRRDRPEEAIERLKESIPYEGGMAFWPTYLRGQAYLRLRQGKEAAAEFDRILTHRGWDVLSPLYPLAHVGRAQAAALVGDVDGARKAYGAFFDAWTNADSDLPVLLDAKREFTRMN